MRLFCADVVPSRPAVGQLSGMFPGQRDGQHGARRSTGHRFRADHSASEQTTVRMGLRGVVTGQRHRSGMVCCGIRASVRVDQPSASSSSAFRSATRSRTGHRRVGEPTQDQREPHPFAGGSEPTDSTRGWSAGSIRGPMCEYGCAASIDGMSELDVVTVRGLSKMYGSRVGAGCIELGRRHCGQGRSAALLGVAVGVIDAATAALLKAVTDIAVPAPLEVLGSWQLYTVIALGIGGLLLNQLAFQAGPIAASLPATATIDPLLSIVGGLRRAAAPRPRRRDPADCPAAPAMPRGRATRPHRRQH
jgi:hypothetical protein